jgi:L-amino acid N-acyltransferase YncA
VLLQAAIDHARSEARSNNWCSPVTRTNEAAAKLYKSAGFVTFGLEPRAIKVDGAYFDKEHMVLFL